MSDNKIEVCGLCGEPMPEGEEMFNYHGYSGPCPKPSKLSDEPIRQKAERWTPQQWEKGYGSHGGITGPSASEWHYMPGWCDKNYVLLTEKDTQFSHSRVVAVIPKANPTWEKIQNMCASAPALYSALEAIRELIGWRGTGIDSDQFYCEDCKQGNLDYTLIQHLEGCYVLKAEAALKAARGEK